MGKNIVHVEFPAQDTERAQRFWASLGGWSFQDSGMPGIDYRMFQDEGWGGAVYTQMQGEQGPVIYFGTDDMDAELANVRELGGETEEKQPIPSVGWFARCKDTEGNQFSLFQSDESAAPPRQ